MEAQEALNNAIDEMKIGGSVKRANAWTQIANAITALELAEVSARMAKIAEEA